MKERIIMKTHVRALGALSLSLGLAALAGCGASQPPRELLDARAAFAKAQSGPAHNVNPDALHEAGESLKRAESSFSAHADDKDTKTLAYVAERRSELADVRARDSLNAQQERAAKTEYQTMSETRMVEAQQQLSATDQQLQAAEQQRSEAEKRANDALEKLGSVKLDARGVILTLPGQVMFSTGKSSLLPGARHRLDQVAEALKVAPDRKVTVEGHTDSTGTPEKNQKLSEERANRVREYLISRGVPADQIQAEGYGDTHPLIDNDTAANRAQNRRVEVIVERRQQQPAQQP
jgi:outer membrane protein OmpA-like peptidoglycan-associated protein